MVEIVLIYAFHKIYPSPSYTAHHFESVTIAYRLQPPNL